MKRTFQVGVAIAVLSAVGVSAFAAAKPGEFGEAAFTASLDLYNAIQINVVKNLNFAHVLAGEAGTVVVAPTDAGAAQFTATGDPTGGVVGSVTQAAITMSNGGSGANNQITVDNWTFGGDMASSGSASFNSSGSLSNLLVGATANVGANNEPGNYSGTATFRLTYV